MGFKEFSEFPDIEEDDYDIKSGYIDNEGNVLNTNNSYGDVSMDLAELIGLLEDDEFENIEELYGITQEEYMHPTKEVLKKVRDHLENTRGKSR